MSLKTDLLKWPGTGNEEGRFFFWEDESETVKGLVELFCCLESIDGLESWIFGFVEPCAFSLPI
jgi:hypothetical protein